MDATTADPAPGSVDISVPASTTDVERIKSVIDDVARFVGFDENDRFQIGTALTEAFAKPQEAVEKQGGSNLNGRDIGVRCRTEDGELAIYVGRADRLGIAAQHHGGKSDSESALAMAEAAMDSVEVWSSPADVVVRMAKRLPST